MPQRIFKKSNKQDMIDLFNLLPDFIYIIEYDGRGIVAKGETEENYTSYFFIDCVLKIDFETDKVEEMIIKRPEEI